MCSFRDTTSPFYPRHSRLNPSLQVFFWNLRYKSWCQENQSFFVNPKLQKKPHDPTVLSFELIPACDRQMDGQTDRHVADG